MLFLDLAISIPKKYLRDLSSLVWKYFCKYFRLPIFFLSSPVINISSTYTIRMILFYAIFPKHRVVFFLHDKDQTLESLMQSGQTGSRRLFQTVEWLQFANLFTLSLSNKTWWLLFVNFLIKNVIEKIIFDVQLMKWPVTCCC